MQVDLHILQKGGHGGPLMPLVIPPQGETIGGGGGGVVQSSAEAEACEGVVLRLLQQTINKESVREGSRL